MAKRRSLGHISAHHAIKSAVVKFIDENDITGSLAEVTAAWEYRLDVVEDETIVLNSKITNVSSSVDVNTLRIYNINSDVAVNAQDIITNSSSITANSSSITANSSNITANADAVVSLDVYIGNVNSDVAVNAQDIITINNELNTIDSDISSMSSSLDSVISDISAVNNEVVSLSSSLASLSASFTLLSASIGSGGNLNVNIPSDSELYFNGDTLMTDADVYISGSGNNLYLHGTNDQGIPAKFEFSITSGSTFISEVSHSDFGEEIDDPWFKFDGDTLLTHADIYVSGSNNYLYLNGTDENGQYGIFYFDIIDGRVIVKQTGSIN